jgi:hypothetical protein
MPASRWNDNARESEESTPEGKAWGVRSLPQRSLLFVLKDGYERFFSYDDFYGGELVESDVLKIYFVTGTATIQGRGLRELSRKVAQERVVYVQEQHISEFEAQDEPSYIEQIKFGPPEPQALGQKPPLVMVVNRAAG